MSPQASDAQRARWDGPSDAEATAFLEARGFTLTHDWCWMRTAPPTAMESDAIDYMVNEWDYGGWVTPRTTAQGEPIVLGPDGAPVGGAIGGLLAAVAIIALVIGAGLGVGAIYDWLLS